MDFLVVFLVFELAMECNGASSSLTWPDIVSTSDSRTSFEYSSRIIIKYSVVIILLINALWNSSWGIERWKCAKLFGFSRLQLYFYDCFFHQASFFCWETLAYRLLHFLIYMSQWGKVCLCISSSLHKSIFSCYCLTNSVHMARNRVHKVLKIDMISLWNLLLLWSYLVPLLDCGTFYCVLTVQYARKVLIVWDTGCPGISSELLFHCVTILFLVIFAHVRLLLRLLTWNEAMCWGELLTNLASSKGIAFLSHF